MRLNNRIILKKNQLLPTFDYTITVLNRLKATDSVLKKDVWYATVLPNCDFTKTVVRNVNGNVVSVGGAYKVMIAKTDKYMPYREWKDNREDHFTLSEGDYIIKGRLEKGELVTPESIQKIYQNHRPDAFQIKTFSDFTGTVELAEHYEVEGV